ncbi:periplasmic heavy metal sensor [Wenxinia saemankumensis]|uniref:Heavy-metal resistance n=1 Tax=Wenxinia saemankumensis TaxID=1447782 RepID=A0A1M6CTJ7_9RHOB|nr:periplasmic heavy metal sensor [Wenxinia saemankumensis]SHI64114.1 Heavy-metal resistance [Wenxinia saemankumensis]
MTDTPPPRRRLRLSRVVLVLSLALNLLVAGLILGAVLRGNPPGGRPGVELAVGPLLDALPPERRDGIRARLRGDDDLRRFDRGARREAMRAFAGALTAEPFDPDAVEALLAAQGARLRGLQDAAQDAFLAELAQMGPEERAAYARRLGGGHGRD